MRIIFIVFALLAPLSAGLLAPAASARRVDPEDDEERRERLEEGRQGFVENCLMCHSEEMTERSRLGPKQWEAEVEKMIGWGAPVPEEQKGPLIAYLADRFGPSRPVPSPDRMALAEAFAADGPDDLAGADARRGGPLYAVHCATCHGAEARGGDLGTALAEKPALLRASEFTKVVLEGRRRMPGFSAALTAGQAAEILAWLRRLPDGQPTR